MKTQKILVIRLHFPTQNLLSFLGLGSNKGFISSYGFNRLVLGFYCFLFCLIPTENRTGVILMLAAVAAERHMQHTEVPNTKVFGKMSKPTL